MQPKIRQPIITVCGHVDHGKTSLLDSIRGSKVAEKEAGGITQKISFTLVPSELIKKRCPILENKKIELKIPGFLFIDTPGHAAFTNLRKRGGSLADLAILVIDINEGIMPQTQEVISILKANKTPFLIALNKVDNISGWRKQSEDLKESIESQAQHTKQDFDEKLYTLIGALQHQGFDADLFFNVNDFTKQLALVPCSARNNEGIQEILFVLCGLSQKFLQKRLTLGKEAKGIILEVKKDKSTNYMEAILYDGTLNKKDEIAIASFDKPILSKIRIMEEALPLSRGYKAAEEATAACGLRMQLTERENILPGMPFLLFNNNLEDINKEFKKELSEIIKTEKEGIIVKADSLGSLEALLTLLRQSGISVSKAGIGQINKQDVITAKANKPDEKAVLAFNTELDEEAGELMKSEKGVMIILNEVVYKLIEDFQKWQAEKRAEIEKEKLLSLTSICKLRILHNFVFHNSKPAIFGINMEAGKLHPGTHVINSNGEEVDKVKNIQKDNKSVKEISEGDEAAISLPNTTFDRQLKQEDFLYSDLNEFQFREFKKNKEVLSQSEIKVLQEIAQIKRKTKATWGV